MKLEILNVTIEVNPKKLLETQVITKNGNYPKKKNLKIPNYPCYGHQICLNRIKKTFKANFNKLWQRNLDN